MRRAKKSKFPEIDKSAVARIGKERFYFKIRPVNILHRWPEPNAMPDCTFTWREIQDRTLAAYRLDLWSRRAITALIMVNCIGLVVWAIISLSVKT